MDVGAQGIKNSMEEAMMLTAPTDGRARGLTGGCDGVPITLRMRLHCELWRDGQVIAGSPSFEVTSPQKQQAKQPHTCSHR